MPEATEVRTRPVPLPANSFHFSELERALDKAVDVEKREDHPSRLAKAVRDHALQPEIITEREKPAVPEGSELKEIKGQDGRTVHAAVSIPAKADSGEEASEQELDSTAQAQRAASGAAGPEAGGAEAGTAADESAPARPKK